MAAEQQERDEAHGQLAGSSLSAASSTAMSSGLVPVRRAKCRVAAVREPLLALPDGDIGFDSEGLRRCVVGLADAGRVR
jgi:hypothetical protein